MITKKLYESLYFGECRKDPEFPLNLKMISAHAKLPFKAFPSLPPFPRRALYWYFPAAPPLK